MPKVEISFELDSIERLKKEIEGTEEYSNIRAYGEYLIERFEKDEFTKEQYYNKKITLKDIDEVVQSKARDVLKSSSGNIPDKVVYGWIVDYIQDGKINVKTETTFNLTQQDSESAKEKALKRIEQEEYERLKKEQEKQKQAELKKQQKEQEKVIKAQKKFEEEHLGQTSLFDL